MHRTPGCVQRRAVTRSLLCIPTRRGDQVGEAVDTPGACAMILIRAPPTILSDALCWKVKNNHKNSKHVNGNKNSSNRSSSNKHIKRSNNKNSNSPTSIVACTVTMTATATAIVQTTLTLTTTMTTVASSSASRCNSSTAAQPLKLPALPPRPCVLQLHHSCQNHSTSQQPAQCSQPQHIHNRETERPSGGQ